MVYRIVFRFLFLVAVLFVAWPFLSWQWKGERTLDVAVIDKTVPVEDYREHLGLFWILENAKIVKPDGELYRAEADYYGNHPVQGVAERNLSLNRQPDLIYITDTYGVYRADLGEEKQTGERSEMLYGGLTSYEWEQLMEVKGERTSLILEFNSIASPTSSSVRRSVEKSMGFEWTGWIGRRFPELQSEEVPVWLKKNVEAQTGKPWTLQGEGIAFVDEGDQVVLLQPGDYDGQVRFELTAEGRRQYPGAADSEYGYWFDIMIPDERLAIDATYKLDLSEKGKAKLRENGIPDEFPAVLRDPDQHSYYFSGDYADIGVKYFGKMDPPESYYDVLALIREDERFYWQSYVPMMRHILDRIQEEKR